MAIAIIALSLFALTSSAQEQPSPRADQLDTSPVTIHAASAPSSDPAGKFCAAWFEAPPLDAAVETKAVRARYTLPLDRSWLLLSFLSCGAASNCAEWAQPNGSYALRYNGRVQSVALGPLGTPEGLQLLGPMARIAGGDANPEALQKALTDLGDLWSTLSPLSFLPIAAGTGSDGFWTGKLHGAKVEHLLLFDARAGVPQGARCAIKPIRSAIVFNHNKDGKYPELDLPRPTKSVAPEDAANLPQYDGAAHHVARIEWVSHRKCSNANDPSCLHYCSGVLVGENKTAKTMTILTAGHCLADDSPDGKDVCPDDLAVCASYNVDMYFSNLTETKGSYVSLPVLHIEVPRSIIKKDALTYDPDYAILTVPDVLPEGTPGLARAPDSVVFHPGSSASESFVVSHLLGHPAEVSPFCRTFRKDSFLYHTCYTQGGSSGAAVWWDDKKDVAPLALHTRAMRDCARPEDADKDPDWRTFRDTNDDFIARCGNRCVGRALSMSKIYCDYCITLGHVTEPVCQQLERLRPASESTCSH